jgi:hypothetical protein
MRSTSAADGHTTSENPMANADLAWLAPHNDAFRIKSQMRCTAFAIGGQEDRFVFVAP